MGGIDANWVSAKRACINMDHGKGYLASVLDWSKHNFIAHMFKNDYRMDSPYMYHIGLSYDSATGKYYWEQPTGTDRIPMTGSVFTRWNKGFPSTRDDQYCVLTAQTSTDFDLGWQNEHCRAVSKRYICQTVACDTDNYCDNLEE
ncbi:unnamed protein product [Strongylus vulgaris]|uniref:C-type lectin domain-containing protein n=1 Tax=Strongylus vulgaris TaxID=40348 RepID=A0A3P7M136_STRVU|nr:unnamed protein product [Strongylus vulgaris]